MFAGLKSGSVPEETSGLKVCGAALNAARTRLFDAADSALAKSLVVSAPYRMPSDAPARSSRPIPRTLTPVRWR